MKRVLLIQPQFAPCSYPTAQRTRLWATHLTRLGWEPIVFAADPRDLEEPADPGFATLLPETLRVVRFRAWNPKQTRRVGLGDLGLRSWWGLRRALKTFFKAETAAAVVFHGPPWFCFTLGPWVRRRFGIPYVLDYIDPWISAPAARFPLASKAHWYRVAARRLEPSTVRQASGIVTISEEALAELRKRYPEIRNTPGVAIPYGFEPSDFAPSLNENLKPSRGLRILRYIGARLPASIPLWESLFAALARRLAEDPALPAKLRLELIGTTYAVGSPGPLLLPVAERFGVAELVTEHPARVPYGESLQRFRDADGLLVMGTTEPHYAASKIFPTLAAAKPLIGVVHEGSEVVPMLRAIRVKGVVTFGSTDELSTLETPLAAALEAFVADRLEAPSTETVEATLAPFTAARMAERVAALLQQITDR